MRYVLKKIPTTLPALYVTFARRTLGCRQQKTSKKDVSNMVQYFRKFIGTLNVRIV